jgi:hypothetical protein
MIKNLRVKVFLFVAVLISVILFASAQLKPVKAQNSFTFIAWGDTRSGTSYLAAMSNHAKDTFNPAFTIYSGDLVDSFSGIGAWKDAINGGSSSGNGMFDITFPIRGNHDGGESSWQSYFNLSSQAQNIPGMNNYNELTADLTYSFDYENVRIIGLDIPGDVAGNALTAAEKSWLESRLSDAQNRSNINHVFLYFHGPIYCCDGHCSGCTTRVCSRDTGSSALTDLINILDKYPKVSATFHGHEHLLNYTHLDSTRNPNIDNPFEHFISGAAGMQYNDLGGMGYLCHPNRYDYFMTDSSDKILRGYMAVTVSGNNYTVRFYSIDSSRTVRLDKTFNCTQSGGCGSGSGSSPTPVPTSTPGGPSPTRTPTPTPTTQSGTATLSISPSSSSISSIGGTRTVNVNVANAVKLGGFEFEVHYNPSIVKVNSTSNVTLGSFLGSSGRSATFLTPVVDNVNGVVKVGAFSFGSVNGPSGSGTLASITFTGAGNGTSSLNIQNILLSSSDTTPVNQPTVTQNGSITVGSGGPTNTPTAYPTTGSGDTYIPAEDTSASSGYPSSNYGTKTTLTASDYYSNDLRTAYLKYQIPTGVNITAASLQLTAALARSVEKYVYTTGSSWSESSLTYNNKPSKGTQVGYLDHLSSTLTVGELVTIPLDANKLSTDSQGYISFIIDNAGSGNTFEFSSKEGSNPPKLVVNTGGTLPTSTPGTGGPPCSLQGDASGNGTVNTADYVIWLNHFDQSTSAGCPSADFNSDGSVNGVDYMFWRSNYGNTSGGPTNTPRPTNTPQPGATNTPTPTRTPTPRPTNTPSGPTPTQGQITGCYRPYTSSSPWNTKATNMPTHPNSSDMISDLSGGRTLTSSTDQYTYPVYDVDNSMPTRTVRVGGNYSNVTNDSSISGGSATVQVPIPSNAVSAAGSDAQIIIVNHDTGDEWGFWQASKNSDGSWSATNGYHYNINWDGVPPSGFGSRGAGVTYLAGLIRPCEIKQGHIDHAIAFAYNYPCSSGTCSAHGWPHYVYPATKSDGKGTETWAFPEGTRLQLQATDSEINSWCGSSSNTCAVIGRALRDYGMITIDNSGSSKIYAEYDSTAHWGQSGIPDISRSTPSVFSINRFRVIDF